MTVHVMVWATVQADSSTEERRLRDLIETLIRQGRWFMVEPWPSGEWRVYLHDEPGARVVLKDYGLDVSGGPDE